MIIVHSINNIIVIPYKNQSDISHFKVFGCNVFVQEPTCCFAQGNLHVADADFVDGLNGWGPTLLTSPFPQPCRSERTPKSTKEFQQYKAYEANLQVEPNSTKEATLQLNKTYGKQDVTFKQTLSSEEAELWKAAIDEECISLMKNEAWELITLPPGHAAIKCLWVFDIKSGCEGVPERYKARVVGCRI